MANESKSEKRRRKDKYNDGYRDGQKKWTSADWAEGSHSDWKDGWNESWTKSRSSWKTKGWSDRWSQGWSSKEWSAESWDKQEVEEDVPVSSARRVVQLTARPGKEVRDKSPAKQTQKVRLQARGPHREPREHGHVEVADKRRREEATESTRRVDCAPSPASPMSVGSSAIEEEDKPEQPPSSGHEATVEMDEDELGMAEPVLPLEPTDLPRARSSSRKKRRAAAAEAARFAAPAASTALKSTPPAASPVSPRKAREAARAVKSERQPSAGIIRNSAESASCPTEVQAEVISGHEKTHRSSKKQRTKATATVADAMPGSSGVPRASTGSPSASNGQSVGSPAQMPEAPEKVDSHGSGASRKRSHEALDGVKVGPATSPSSAARRQSEAEAGGSRVTDASVFPHEDFTDAQQREFKDKVAERLTVLGVGDPELVAELIVVMSIENMPREEQVRDLDFLKDTPDLFDWVEGCKEDILRKGSSGKQVAQVQKAPLRAQLTPNPHSEDLPVRPVEPRHRTKKNRAASRSRSSSQRPKKKMSYVVVTKKLRLQPNPEQAEDSDAAEEAAEEAPEEESQMVTSGSDADAENISEKAESETEEKPSAADQAAVATDKKNELLAQMTRRLQEIITKLSDRSLDDQTREQWQAMAQKIQESMTKLDTTSNDQVNTYSQAQPAPHMA